MDILLIPLLQIVSIGLSIFSFCIIGQAILSWLVAFNVVNYHNPLVSRVGRALDGLCAPALRPIQRFVPTFGGIDISPVLLLMAIWFLQSVIERLIYKL